MTTASFSCLVSSSRTFEPLYIPSQHHNAFCFPRFLLFRKKFILLLLFSWIFVYITYIMANHVGVRKERDQLIVFAPVAISRGRIMMPVDPNYRATILNFQKGKSFEVLVFSFDSKHRISKNSSR